MPERIQQRRVKGWRKLIDPRDPGKRVWYRQTLGGWYEDSPLYLFTPDEERGAAGVEFDVITTFDLDDLTLDEFGPDAHTEKAEN